MLTLRVVGPDEVELCRRLGQIVLEAYLALADRPDDPGYEQELVDVVARAASATVVAAFHGGPPDAEPVPVGCVTYLGDATNEHAEHDDPDAASFRMLGVATAGQGRGAGRALTQWCIDRARSDGRQRILIHSGSWMTRAHALYGSMGFVRRPDLDWSFQGYIHLWGFALELA